MKNVLPFRKQSCWIGFLCSCVFKKISYTMLIICSPAQLCLGLPMMTFDLSLVTGFSSLIQKITMPRKLPYIHSVMHIFMSFYWMFCLFNLCFSDMYMIKNMLTTFFSEKGLAGNSKKEIRYKEEVYTWFIIPLFLLYCNSKSIQSLMRILFILYINKYIYI